MLFAWKFQEQRVNVKSLVKLSPILQFFVYKFVLPFKKWPWHVRIVWNFIIRCSHHSLKVNFFLHILANFHANCTIVTICINLIELLYILVIILVKKF